MKLTKLISVVMAFVMVAAVFAGCAGTSSKPEEESKAAGEAKGEEAKISGTIEVAGSTSVQPLAQNLADAFMAKHPDVIINIQGIGSSKGVKAAKDATADIGTASRELKTEEKGWGLTEHIIARDGIAVAVHPNNPVSDLTKEQVMKIFKGEIKNWKEIGGADKAIIVVSREAGSGTRGAFEEIVGFEGELREDALIADGNGAVKQNVQTKENAIGYLSLGYLNDSVKALKVGGIEPTVENIKDGTYPVARPFLMLTNGEMKPQVKAYMNFIMSDEGQEIVAEDYIPVK